MDILNSHLPLSITTQSNYKMTQKESIRLFEERKVRAIWDDEQEEWYFRLLMLYLF